MLRAFLFRTSHSPKNKPRRCTEGKLKANHNLSSKEPRTSKFVAGCPKNGIHSKKRNFSAFFGR